MPDFELMFSIGYVDDDTIQDIYDRHDALVSGHGEITLLAITAEGTNVLQAAQNVITDLRRHTKTRILWCVEDDQGLYNQPTADEVKAINAWLEVHLALQEDQNGAKNPA